MTRAKAINSLGTIRDRLAGGAPVSFAGLGDSLTAGWSVGLGFFDRFIAQLKELYPKTPITGFNAGISGDTAKGGEMRIQEVLEREPDVVIVEFGINDMYGGVPIESYANSISNISLATVAAGGLPVLVTSCPISFAQDAKEISRFYDVLQALGREHRVPVADLAGYWLTYGSKDEELYFGDGVHPTEEGHALMCRGLVDFFTAVQKNR